MKVGSQLTSSSDTSELVFFVRKTPNSLPRRRTIKRLRSQTLRILVPNSFGTRILVTWKNHSGDESTVRVIHKFQRTIHCTDKLPRRREP